MSYAKGTLKLLVCLVAWMSNVHASITCPMCIGAGLTGVGYCCRWMGDDQFYLKSTWISPQDTEEPGYFCSEQECGGSDTGSDTGSDAGSGTGSDDGDPSGLHLSSENAKLLFGPNGECSIELRSDGKLHSNCAIEHVPQ